MPKEFDVKSDIEEVAKERALQRANWKSAKKQILLTLLCFAALGALFIAFRPKPPYEPEALVVVESAVLERITAPETAKFSEIGSIRVGEGYIFTGKVETRKLTGPPIKNEFTVGVDKGKSGFVVSDIHLANGGK